MERMTRRGRRRARVLVGCILMTPVVGTGVLYGLPQLHAAANRLSELKVGTSPTAATDPLVDEQAFLSSGFGWEPEEEDATAPPQIMPEPPASTQERVETDTAPSPNPGAKPYPTSWATGAGGILKTHMGPYSGSIYANLDRAGQVRNETTVPMETILAQSRLLPEFRIHANAEPEVLIMHTHTTESFEPCARESYDASFNYRTTDEAYNVVAVGNALAAQLQAEDIGVIHDTTIHDYPSYNGSYVRSGTTVSAILAAHPTIKVVLDIHRDAIAQNRTLIQPVVTVDGQEAAQVMIISGCDDGTMNMPNYLQNFRLASLFQQQMETDYAGLTRPILFDYRKYNQNLTTGSLLLEIGSHGNTQAQVQYAGTLVGKSIAKALKSISSEDAG